MSKMILIKFYEDLRFEIMKDMTIPLYKVLFNMIPIIGPFYPYWNSIL